MSYSNLLNHTILDLEVLDQLLLNTKKPCVCPEECLPCHSRDQIILHHLRLVHLCCRRSCKSNPDELMAVGVIALHGAIDKFTVGKTNEGKIQKFYPFARKRIEWAILKEYHKNKVDHEEEECYFEQKAREHFDTHADMLGDHIQHLMSGLTEHEKYLVDSYYGIGCKEKNTVQLAKEFDCTSQTIVNRIGHALNTMKKKEGLPVTRKPASITQRKRVKELESSYEKRLKKRREKFKKR